MIIRSKTFAQWFNANLKDYAWDIARHGADSGFPGITYYTDTVKLYDRFEGEIWDALYDDAQESGYDSVPAFIASFNRSDVSSGAEFKNLLVWYMAERIARDFED